MERGVGSAGALRGAGIGVDPSLSGAIAALDREIDRLLPLRDSLMVIADRLAGSRPRDASNVEPRSPSNSMIEELQRKRNVMNEIITSCEVERDRLMQALGG